MTDEIKPIYRRVEDHNQGKDFEAIERYMAIGGYELKEVEVRHDGKQSFFVYVFHLTRVGADAPSALESNQDSPADAPMDCCVMFIEHRSKANPDSMLDTLGSVQG